MSEEIIEDLRWAHDGVWRGITGKDTLFSRAADRIEALEAALAERQPAKIVYSPDAKAMSDRCEALLAALARYRKEVPLGHQPHMLAHEVDLLLGQSD